MFVVAVVSVVVIVVVPSCLWRHMTAGAQLVSIPLDAPWIDR
jgi:hypothetical protein